MSESITTIAIRNPRVIEVAEREKQFGAGRTLVEVVTNLFLEKAEQRRLEREIPEHSSEIMGQRVAAKRRREGREND